MGKDHFAQQFELNSILPHTILQTALAKADHLVASKNQVQKKQPLTSFFNYCFLHRLIIICNTSTIMKTECFGGRLTAFSISPSSTLPQTCT